MTNERLILPYKVGPLDLEVSNRLIANQILLDTPDSSQAGKNIADIVIKASDINFALDTLSIQNWSIRANLVRKLILPRVENIKDNPDLKSRTINLLRLIIQDNSEKITLSNSRGVRNSKEDALNILWELEGEKAIPDLLTGLGHSIQRVRDTSKEIIESNEIPQIEPMLLDIVSTNEPGTKSHLYASLILSNKKNQNAVKPLLLYLISKSGYYRVDDSLINFGPEILPQLINLAENPQELFPGSSDTTLSNIKNRALTIIKENISNASREEKLRVIPSIVTLLIHDRMRGFISDGLFELGPPTLPALFDLLGNPPILFSAYSDSTIHNALVAAFNTAMQINERYLDSTLEDFKQYDKTAFRELEPHA